MPQGPVRRFTKQRRACELSRRHIVIVDGAKLHDGAQALIEDLREWMGLANFERTLRRDRTFTGAGGPIRIRKLNEDVLAAFREIERRAPTPSRSRGATTRR